MVFSVLCVSLPLHGARAGSMDLKSPPPLTMPPKPSGSSKKAGISVATTDRRLTDTARLVASRRRNRPRSVGALADSDLATQFVSLAADNGTIGDVIASGTASWYGSSWHGRRTSSGEPFDENALTAAHPWLPLGTRVRVTVQGSSESVVVIINDRQGSATRVIDLSKAAARELGILNRGVARVTLTRA